MSGFAAFHHTEGRVPGQAGGRAAAEPMRDAFPAGAGRESLVSPVSEGHLVAGIEPIRAAIERPPARTARVRMLAVHRTASEWEMRLEADHEILRRKGPVSPWLRSQWQPRLGDTPAKSRVSAGAA